MSDIKYAYEVTKYPKKFERTYWGRFPHTQIDKEIIDNRNLFVEQFGIRSICRMRLAADLASQLSPYIDHPEVYRARHRRIIFIFSNYESGIDEIIEDMGFEKYKPLYSKSAETYIRLFKDEYEFKRLANDVNISGFGEFFRKKRRRVIKNLSIFCKLRGVEKEEIELIEFCDEIPEFDTLLKYADLLRLEEGSFERKYFFRLAGF